MITTQHFDPDPAELTLRPILVARGWGGLLDEFPGAEAEFGSLLPAQQALMAGWLRGADLTMTRIIVSLAICYDVNCRTRPTPRPGEYYVDHEPGKKPYLVTLNSLSCSCDRWCGQGKYERDFGVCAHIVTAALREAASGPLSDSILRALDDAGLPFRIQ